MKRLALTLLVLAVCAAPSLAGWRYSSYYQSGYTYYAAPACGSYKAGYYQYYTPTYYAPTYYPTYSVSYNPDSAKQLQIIDKAMDVLTRFAEAGIGGGGNGNGVPQIQRGIPTVIKEPTQIVGVRCAACHEAGQVQAKGSKLTLLKDGKVPLADLKPEDRQNIVKRIYSRDPKECMPPSKPMVEAERKSLADFLGVTVVESPQ